MPNHPAAVYPTMAPGTWWHLRRRFRKAMPERVTRNYLVSALSSTAEAAPSSTLPDLQRMQLVDEEGVPTALAAKWRDAAQYRDVCTTIVERVYPASLGELTDPNAIAAWFANETSAGEQAAARMTAFYLTLRDADLTKLSPIVTPLDP